MWAEVSSSAPHLLHSRLSDSPSRWRCLLRVSCPVRRPVIALDWVLLKDRKLALSPIQGPKISYRACLWFRVGTGGGLLWTWWRNFGFRKMCAFFFWLAVDLSGTQEELRSVELVGFNCHYTVFIHFFRSENI